MRFTLEETCAEDRIHIAELNQVFNPRNISPNPCLDAKWKRDDGSATFYMIDRSAGPGWMGVQLVLCLGEDRYLISASWDEPLTSGKYQVKARIYRHEELPGTPPDAMREMAEAAICVSCEYGRWTWLEGMPFAGVEISYPLGSN